MCRTACRRDQCACCDTSPGPRASAGSLRSSASSGEQADPDARGHVDLGPAEQERLLGVTAGRRVATDSATIERAARRPRRPPSGVRSRSESSSRNSSPPCRATRSVSRVASRRRSDKLLEELISQFVTQRVVDQFEVVDIVCTRPRLPASCRFARAIAELEEFLEHDAVRQAGELVVVGKERGLSSASLRPVMSSITPWTPGRAVPRRGSRPPSPGTTPSRSLRPISRYSNSNDSPDVPTMEVAGKRLFPIFGVQHPVPRGPGRRCSPVR